MQLGPQVWNAAKPFYDQLTLAVDGDGQAEQPAARNDNINGVFPAYEKFWRHHVCPATQRPHGINFRQGVADIISIIVQRNYSVFVYAVEAREFIAKARQGDTGPRNRNYYVALMYAGNALQVFTELRRALCGKPDRRNMGTMNDLSRELGVQFDPFPDWNSNWKAEQESASNYRNYVTHQGWFYSVFQQATGKQYVLNRDEFRPREPWTWTHAENDYRSNPSGWIEFDKSCQGIVDDTIAFLDLAYEKIAAVMEPLLVIADYQRLWGWQDHQPIPAAGIATPQVATGNRTTGIAPSWLCGSTSSPVDTRPRPPGSGEEIV